VPQTPFIHHGVGSARFSCLSLVAARFHRAASGQSAGWPGLFWSKWGCLEMEPWPLFCASRGWIGLQSSATLKPIFFSKLVLNHGDNSKPAPGRGVYLAQQPSTDIFVQIYYTFFLASLSFSGACFQDPSIVQLLVDHCCIVCKVSGLTTY
jgi:hypothetical protein